MKYLVLLLLTSMAVGCTKSNLCDAGKAASSLVSAQIGAQLECKNLDAVQADIEKKLVDIKICEASSTAAKAIDVGGLICKPLVDTLATGLLLQVPTAWGCTGGKLTDELKAKLLDACSKAL